MIENINNTPQDSGQGDNLYVATTKINNNFDYIQGILNDVLTTGSTISISQVSGLQAALDSINNELANIPTILQDIVDINTAITSINNTLNSQNISITELLSDVVDLQSQINLKVDEAPIDGSQYARQNGSWTIVSGGTSGGGDYLPLSGGTMYSGASIFFNNTSKISEGLVDAGTGGNKGIALTCAVGYEWKFEAGEAYLTNLSGNFITIKDYARSLPTVNDDITKGYIAGSYWRIDSAFYNCLDAAEGAAVWVQATNFGNLQLVTDNGATTTNPITVTIEDQPGVIVEFEGSQTSLSRSHLSITTPANKLQLNVDNAQFIDENLNIKTLFVGETTETSQNYTLPDKPTGSYTLATTSDVPTKTSDLINDGDNGTSHFISLEDLPSTLSLYPTTTASGIGGYNRLVTSITDPVYNTTAVNVSTGAITGTDQFIAGLITQPGLIIGNPGVFNMTTLGNIRKTAGSGQAEFYFRVYKRTSGGTETLILQSSNTPQITSAIYVEFFASGLWNDGIFVSTDRIVLKFYGTKVGGGSNPTYDFQFGGAQPIRSIVPVPFNVLPVIGLDGLTDVTISAATNNQLLSYESSTQLWKNKTINSISSLNSLTASTQTLVTGSTGTNFNIISSDSTHTFNLPTASATNRGALSSADWTSFNGRKKKVVSDTTSATVSGTTSLTLVKTYELTAGTLSTAGFLDIFMYSTRTGTSAIHTMGLYINTTNNFATATLIATSTTGGNFTPVLPFKATYALKNNLLIGGIYSNTTGSNYVPSSTQVSVGCNNTSSSIWFFVGVTPSNVAQTIDFQAIEIIN